VGTTLKINDTHAARREKLISSCELRSSGLLLSE